MKTFILFFLLCILCSFRNNENQSIELITKNEYDLDGFIDYQIVNNTSDTVFEYTICLVIYSNKYNEFMEFGKDLTFPDKRFDELIKLLSNTKLERKHLLSKILKENYTNIELNSLRYKLKVVYKSYKSEIKRILFSNEFKITRNSKK